MWPPREVLPWPHAMPSPMLRVSGHHLNSRRPQYLMHLNSRRPHYLMRNIVLSGLTASNYAELVDLTSTIGSDKLAVLAFPWFVSTNAYLV